LAAAFERGDLRGDVIGFRDHADFEIVGKPSRSRGLHCSPIPAVGKSENLVVQRHHVENRPALDPPAHGCTFAGVFAEPQGTQPVAECRIRCIGRDFGDHIHIERGSRIGGGLVGNEETCHRPAHEYQFAKQRAQQPGRGDQLLKV
jgi:hypothetical protein